MGPSHREENLASANGSVADLLSYSVLVMAPNFSRFLSRNARQ